MAILVTGGAGYIGSISAHYFAEQGESVVVLDTLQHGNLKAVGSLPFVCGDVRDTALVERVLKEHQITSVVHLAADKSVAESMTNPAKYFDNNVNGTLRLLESMTKVGVDEIVFSSTCAVYGTPQSLPVTEDMNVNPESPYAESKFMAEQLLDWFGRCHGIRSVSLRYFNAAGATGDGSIGENPSEAANLIPLVLKAALGDADSITVFGTDYPTKDGSGVRDYIHVLDLADAHARALDHLRAGGQSLKLNIGTGVAVSVLEIISKVEEISGVDVPVQFGNRRPGDPAASWANPALAKATIGWEAERGLDDIISSAWKWQSTHPAGFDS